MKRIQVISGAVTLAAAALLLSACTAPVSAPTAGPTTQPSIAATATPTPTPTPTAVADPSVVRVPFDCDALYTPATARPLVGTKLTANGGKDAPLASLEDVAERQAGALSCDWSGGIGTDIGPSNILDISVAPDAAATFAANLAANQPAKDHPVADTAGDKSSYYCKNGGRLFEGYTCNGEMVVGDYWVSIALVHTVPVTTKAAAAAIQAALAKTAAAITAAPAISLPAWTVPAGPAATFCTNGTAQVRRAMGDATLKPLTLSGSSDTAADAGNLDGHYAYCVWSSKTESGVDVSILDGGSWALPELKPMITGDSTLFGTKFASMDIPGASSALVACDKADCDVFAAVGQSAVEMFVSGSSRTQTLQRVAGLVAAVKSN